ncbi:MAG: hypothetical protein ACR2NU_13280 [Aeoliella sp.]
MVRLTLSVLLLVCVLPCIAIAKLTPAQLEQVETWIATPSDERSPLASLKLPDQLSKQEAVKAAAQLWKLVAATDNGKDSPLGELPKKLSDQIKDGEDGKVMVTSGSLRLGKHIMPFSVIRREKEAPAKAGRALFFCLHGGGQHGPAKGPHSWPVNSREFETQFFLAMRAYPPEGIYWIPRMADDRLGRWWHAHNQQAIDQVIDHALVHWGVNPNRVYLLGISEGGYGTDILAPFMADRFGGACAMAAGVGLGNPPENLRNLAFRTDVGEKDTMFDRQKLAVAFHKRLDELHAEDPNGYTHSINLQKGRGHGIDYREGPKWMAEHERTPFPKKIVWIDKPLHGKRRGQFYWIRRLDDDREGIQRIVALVDRDENRIDVTAERIEVEGGGGFETHQSGGEETGAEPLTGESIELLLSDALVDLDRPVKIALNGEKHTTIEPIRSAATLLESLIARPDQSLAATVRVDLGGE